MPDLLESFNRKHNSINLTAINIVGVVSLYIRVVGLFTQKLFLCGRGRRRSHVPDGVFSEVHSFDVERGKNGLLVGNRGINQFGLVRRQDNAHVTQVHLD